jgi:ribosomal-protein-alanine N-acetyltransferase
MASPLALTLRPALPQEADVLAEMSRVLIEAGLPWRYTPSRIAALMRDADTVVLVAIDPAQARIHGFAAMQFGDEQAHLTLMCVQPLQQRRGTGRRLLEWLIESAQVAGIVAITLELRTDNDAALAFYRRLGFVEAHLVPRYYEGRIAARRMRRTLREPA